MNFDDYSFEELIDVFVQIDDHIYTVRALNILEEIAKRLNATSADIQLNQILLSSTESNIKYRHGDFTSNPSNFIDEVYTEDGVVVRDKLIRLKMMLNKT